MLADFQLGGPEDPLLRDIDVARASGVGGGVGGQQETSFRVNPSMAADAADTLTPAQGTRQPTGKVRDIKFLDVDVAQSQLSAQHYLVNGPSSLPPCASHLSSLGGKRLLVIVCESKVRPQGCHLSLLSPVLVCIRFSSMTCCQGGCRRCLAGAWTSRQPLV